MNPLDPRSEGRAPLDLYNRERIIMQVTTCGTRQRLPSVMAHRLPPAT